MKRAVVVFSGGQDSTTCLVQALQQYDEVHCVTFDYGQRHRAEIDVARELALKLGAVAHKVLDVTLLNELAVSYPDCRDEFVKALHHAVSLGMAKDIRFETPLMWLNKAETWALADFWGQLDLVRQETLTCYNGIKGDGCGQCAACNLRANGLNQYLGDKVGVMAVMKQKTGLAQA